MEEELVAYIESYREETVRYLDTYDLPGHMTGEDVWQDMWLELLESDIAVEDIRGAGFFIDKGRKMALNAIRSERGEAHDVDGNEQPRVFMAWIEDLDSRWEGNVEENFLCQEIMSRLPEEDAKLLYLHFMEGYTVRELGEKSDVSRRISRALKAAREVVDEVV